MPSHYAHYRFGAQLIHEMPAAVRRPVQRFRQLFDVGLHGPDLFFYHNIFIRDSAVELGHKFHEQTGTEFFTRVCKRMRLEPTEAGRAYLYGVLAHYCLDSICHPFVNEQTADDKIGHVELETEFDRYLLVLDGKQPPNTFDCSPHMKLTRGECITVADFFYPATPGMVNMSIRNMAGIVKWLASPKGMRRNALKTAVKVTGDKFSQHVMSRTPNGNCSHLDEPMMALYEQAVQAYPVMLEQMLAHMDHNAPLGELFEKPFG